MTPHKGHLRLKRLDAGDISVGADQKVHASAGLDGLRHMLLAGGFLLEGARMGSRSSSPLTLSHLSSLSVKLQF